MGTLRKMGAFLGLVPDEQRRADHDRYADPDDVSAEYRGDYADARYDSEHVGDYRTDYDAEYDDEHSGEYSAHEYQHQSSEYTADHTRGSYTDSEHSSRRSHRFAEPVSVMSHSGAYAGAGDHSPSAGSPYVHGALAVQPDAELTLNIDKAVKPATIKLTGFADARQVGESYRDGQAVILDMTELSDVEARRMVDFAAGLAFGRHGSIDKVTTKVFMLHQDEQAGR